MKKARKIKEPSGRQMAVFAKKFTKAQWEDCCEYDRFVRACLTDLHSAERLAVKILQGEYDDDAEEFASLRGYYDT